MKKIFLSIFLLPSFLFANGWSAGYTHLDIDGDTLGGVTGSYTWNVADSWDIELGVILGVKDETYRDSNINLKLELDPSAFLKAHYNFSEQFHAGLTYADFAATVSGCSGSTCAAASASGGELGMGIGATFGNVTVSFDTLEDTDLLSVQYNF
tara:strand:- start:1159 stop:1617 length:459 start_codon:yes stop_codon:yes gene_type:complete